LEAFAINCSDLFAGFLFTICQAILTPMNIMAGQALWLKVPAAKE